MYLLIRCDASLEIGSGHAMRCMALAQHAASQGARIIFAMAEVSPGIETPIRNEGFAIRRLSAKIGSVQDRAWTLECAKSEKTDWIVLDGYGFRTDYQREIVNAGVSCVLAFDDYRQTDFYSAHLVLNQNLGADEGLYVHRAAHTKLLLRPSFAVLRKEFQHWRDWRRDVSAGENRVLISLGGSDPQNVTSDVLRALESPESGELELDVVAGGANPHLELLEKVCRSSRHRARLTVNATDMDERMARAAAAITAGGSTCWELCFMQLPALVLILAENQEIAGGKLGETGAAVVLGKPDSAAMHRLPGELRALLNDAPKRAKMSAAGRKTVDGLGAERVFETMTHSI